MQSSDGVEVFVGDRPPPWVSESDELAIVEHPCPPEEIGLTSGSVALQPERPAEAELRIPGPLRVKYGRDLSDADIVDLPWLRSALLRLPLPEDNLCQVTAFSIADDARQAKIELDPEAGFIWMDALPDGRLVVGGHHGTVAVVSLEGSSYVLSLPPEAEWQTVEAGRVDAHGTLWVVDSPGVLYSSDPPYDELVQRAPKIPDQSAAAVTQRIATSEVAGQITVVVASRRAVRVFDDDAIGGWRFLVEAPIDGDDWEPGIIEAGAGQFLAIAPRAQPNRLLWLDGQSSREVDVPAARVSAIGRSAGFGPIVLGSASELFAFREGEFRLLARLPYTTDVGEYDFIPLSGGFLIYRSGDFPDLQSFHRVSGVCPRAFAPGFTGRVRAALKVGAAFATAMGSAGGARVILASIAREPPECLQAWVGGEAAEATR
ncbi:MAG: hypothetical protein HY791_20145 [Deltaproteobacteria bacterium]|nr:hypothetical protein [Deltaproteobacteria bacterium]